MKTKPATTEQTALSLRQIAAEWGVGYDHLFNLVQSGKLKAFMVGRAWRVKRTEIARYERDNSNISPKNQ
jgi:excisionase family DNA binding protein